MRYLPRPFLVLTLLVCVSALARANQEDADALFAEGAAAFDAGRFDRAAAAWDRAAAVYRESGDRAGSLRARLRLASAYQFLGKFDSARAALDSALEDVSSDIDRMALLSASGALRTSFRNDPGQSRRAEDELLEALRIARELPDDAAAAGILNDLGNLRAARVEYDAALEAYDESAELAARIERPMLLAKARTNAALAAQDATRPDRVRSEVQAARDALAGVGDGYEKAHLLITLGTSAQRLPEPRQAYDLYREAIGVAERIGSDRAGCYAWGHLGSLYETDPQRQEDALRATRKAVFLAQKVSSPDALYRWEWQLGRLHRAGGRTDAAIAAHQRAAVALEGIRNDIALFGTREGQTFRQTVGRLYFDLADLQLQRSGDAADPAQVQQYLRAATQTVEQLKTAELEDYFQDDCVRLARAQERDVQELIRDGEAVVYIIPLEERTEILLMLPGEMMRVEPVKVSRERLEEEVKKFRRAVEKTYTYEWKAHAAQLYEWLVRPLEGAMEKNAIETLVFVPDGELRTIPFSALFDGEKFLIQKKTVVISPGLTLAAGGSGVSSAGARATEVLAAGIAKDVGDFKALEHVPEELAKIRQVYPAQRPLFNDEFLKETFSSEFERRPYTVVHIASHGQFNRKVDDTFIVTANADEPLTLSDLEQIIQPSRFRNQPVDLLTLSACETARGDDSARAALGLAGVTVKAGARTAVATLWCVNDRATSELVGDFYATLQSQRGARKAAAVRKAQNGLIDGGTYAQPGYWSAFIIVGDWR